MFIDISTYVGHWPFRRLRYNTLDGLDKLAREFDITHMVVSNLNGFFYKNANDANLELSEELRTYNGKTKFLPLAIVNPAYPEWEQDARDCIARGFAGFEIAPLYHGYSLAPEMLYDEYNSIHRAAKVLDLAEELDVPVRICSGFEDYRARSPRDVQKNIRGDDYYALLSANRNAHVIINRADVAFSFGKLGELIRERKNTYLDTAFVATLATALAAKMVENVDETQLCFGSLSPFNYMDSALLRIDYASEFDLEKMKVAPARAFKTLR